MIGEHILEHAILGTATEGYVDAAVGVENLWDRVGTTLSPHTANDNIDLGSGAFTTSGFLDMTGGHTEVADPTHGEDAVNFQTLQDALGARLEWYLSDSASADVEEYKLLSMDNDAAQNTVTADGTSDGQALDEWVTIAGSPGDITIADGDLLFHFYAKVARASSTDFLYAIKTQVYKRASGGFETQIDADITSSPTLDTDTTLYAVHVHIVEPEDLAVGDRIVVKLTTVRTGTAPRTNPQVVTLYIGGATPTHLALPVTLAILGRYVRIDGSTPLTADWNVGAYDLTAVNLTLSGTLTVNGDAIYSDGNLVIAPGGGGTTLTLNALVSGTNVTHFNYGANDEMYLSYGTAGSVFMRSGGNTRFTLDASGNLTLVGTITGTSLTDGTLSIVGGDLTTTGTISTPELFNSAGDLKIQPNAQGDIHLFGDTDVGDENEGKSCYLWRMASEKNSSLRTYYTDAPDLYSVFTDDWYFFHNDNVPLLLTYTHTYLDPYGVGIVSLFNQVTSGLAPTFRQSGYITADTAAKYIQWQVNDTTDYFELTREDTYVLGLDIQMPLVTDTITGSDDWSTTGNFTCGGASAGMSIIASGLTVNDAGGGGANDDFIAETNSHADAFVVDASADVIYTTVAVGINETTPTSLLHVTGLSTYANNADARTGGLTTGAFYSTGGDPDLVCVVHDAP